MLIQIGLGFTPVIIVKAALETKAGIGRIVRGASKLGDSATGKARERARSSNYYQNKEMVRQARANERRRGNVASYTELMTGTGLRSEMARRRAAGGMTAQLFNTNRAGQERILTAAQEQLRKERNEEAHRAAQRMTSLGVEGDADLMAIATTAEGGTFRQERNGRPTGTTMQVGRAERQAAIEELVKQGRVGRLRDLEATGPARGIGGQPNPNNELHEMLDEAYKEHGSKLADKAPDLMPNRRATNGTAAFTDLKPADVADWHESTVEAANRWYTATAGADGTPLTAAELAERRTEQARMVRAFADATRQPGTRSKMSRQQVERVRAVMADATAAGATFDQATVVDAINDTYNALN